MKLWYCIFGRLLRFETFETRNCSLLKNIIFFCEIIKISVRNPYRVPDMIYLGSDGAILRIFVAVPELSTTINLAAIRALDNVTRPCVLSEPVPAVIALRMSTTRYHNFIAIVMALFANVHPVLVLMLITTPVQISNISDTFLAKIFFRIPINDSKIAFKNLKKI